MSSMIGEAFVRLRSDDTLYRPEVRRQVERTTRDLERSTREVSRFGRGALVGTGALSQLGRAAAFASASFIGGAGLVVGIKTASEAASNLNEQIARSGEIFGRSAASIEAWAQTSATSLLLARDQAIAFASDFGTILIGLGQAEDQAARTSSALVQLGADLASFANTPVPDALQAIRSGLVGEIEPLRRYGVILSEAAVGQEALANTGKETVEQLTAQEKVQARLNLIFKQTTLQQGDVARTAGTLANQQRQLSANVRNVAIEIGEVLNPELNRLITSLNEWLSDTENQETVQREFQNLVEDGTAIVEGFASAIETIHEITDPLVESVGGLANAIEILVIAMAANKVLGFGRSLAFVGAEAATATTKVGRMQTALGRLGLLGAITIPLALGVGMDELSVDVETIADNAEELGKIREAFGPDVANEIRRSAEELGRFRAHLEAIGSIEEVRSGRTSDPFFGLPAPLPLVGGAFAGPGRQASPLEQLRLAVAAATLTAGTEDDVRALTAQREQYSRALEFALEQVRLGRGDTAQFADEAERLSGEIAGINSELASITEENAQKAAAARQRAIEALIPGRIGGIAGGFGDLAREFITGRIGGVTGGTAETDALANLGRAANIAQLRRQIAETRGKTEEELLPFLEAERDAITKQLRILNQTGTDKEKILIAVLEQARIEKRIADVRKESEFSVQDFFSLAAGEFAALGSNVGAIHVALSPQEAGGAAVRAARSVSVNQHFYGQQPNPAQALQQASQAARALR